MHRIVLLSLLAACHDAAPLAMDAPAGLDSVQPSAGLFVAWRSDPMLPGPVTASVTLSDVRFDVDRFEVQSDADGGTSRSRYALVWSSAMAPAQEAFPDAPSGLYSRVSITLGGYYEQPFEIHGTWVDAGKSKAFRISDRGTLKAKVEMSTMLAAGDAATIKIAVDLEDAIGGVDFRRLREDDGELVLSIGDPQLGPFRARLAHAFHIVD